MVNKHQHEETKMCKKKGC